LGSLFYHVIRTGVPFYFVHFLFSLVGVTLPIIPL
jgi:hypothetical protein